MNDRKPHNSVTDRSYWNAVWSRGATRLPVLDERDFYAGSNGLFVKLVRRHLGDMQGRSVVELGGGGRNVRLLAMAKWLKADASVVDFSDDGLRVAASLFESNHCRAQFINADLGTWQPQRPFDVVVHWGVLEHFLDPRPLLEKSVAALAPGGALLFSMPNMQALAAGLWKRWSPDNWSKHVLHSDEAVLSVLRDLGLHEVRGFHYGIPFIKMEAWERRLPAVQWPFDALQKLGSASARVVPVFHRWGHRSLSMERGFFARRAA